MSEDTQPHRDAETRGPDDETGPDHESEDAELDQRDAGAQEEQVGAEANLRPEEDETAPGS